MGRRDTSQIKGVRGKEKQSKALPRNRRNDKRGFANGGGVGVKVMGGGGYLVQKYKVTFNWRRDVSDGFRRSITFKDEGLARQYSAQFLTARVYRVWFERNSGEMVRYEEL